MFEKGRETLPVAITELQRQKQIEEEILAEIERSLAIPDGMTERNRLELNGELATTRRMISNIAFELMIRTEYAA
jgi:hypothetical protein